MKPHDLANVARLVADIWPAWKPSKGMMDLWAELLADIEGPEAIVAVKLHASEGTFPPTIAELRKLVLTERGLGAYDQKIAARKLLGLEAQPKAVRREDILGGTDDAWRIQARAALAAKYAERERLPAPLRANDGGEGHIGEVLLGSGG